MTRIHVIGLILLSISWLNIKTTNNIITLFIEKYPTMNLPEHFESEHDSTLSKPLLQPFYVNPKEEKTYVVENFSGVSGIYAFYKGYAQASNFLGQITFPRKQQSETVYLIITENISPAFIVGPSTIGYWKIAENSSTAVYEMKIDYDDSANTYFINTTKVALPESNIISLQSIIIIGNPDTVYVPEGASIAEFTANLTLPTMYVKDDFDFSTNASRALELKSYFVSSNSSYQQKGLNVAKLSSGA